MLGENKNAVTKANKYDDTILSYCNNMARSRDEIQNYVGVKSRSYFTIKILKPLLESGALEATSSSKSKKIKYITSNKNQK